MPIKPEELITVERITDLKSSKKDEVLEELIKLLATSPNVTDEKELRTKIFERERISSTGVGVGMAIPHVKIPSIKDFVVAVGRHPKGIDFDSLDGKPTHLVVMIGCNNAQSGDFLRVLARLVTKLKEASIQQRVLEAESPKQVRDIFIEESILST